jgi:outer membrane cobalamin receptor
MNRGIILLSFVATSWLFGVEELEKIVVTDVTQNLEQSGKLKDVIVKTEVVSKKVIEDKMASKFSEAVDGAVGVQSATGCSLCGLKRVKINGLKGEHTTVLFDDVPMHSTVSSYYGMDAISMAGIETIEIARGGGSALIAPESIGGVINIKSQKIKANALEATIESVDGKMATSILGSLVTPDGKTKASLNVSNSKTSQVDGDNNGVSESPSIDNKSVRLKVSNDIGERDNLNFVYNRLNSKVKGGGVDGYAYGVTGNSDPLFVDNDVHKKYIG